MNTTTTGNRSWRLLISVTAAIVMMAVLVLMVAGPAAAQDSGTPSQQPPWTAGQIAANGPIPGDVTQYGAEMECIQGIETPGYFPSFNGAELTDSERSGIWPCATFTGSFTGTNTVYAWRFPESYVNAAYINNRRPGELYIVGGGNPPLTGTMPAGPFLAKVDATTGQQVWRTYFDNGNVSGNWIAATNLNILPSNHIVHSWGDNIALVNGDNGLILKTTKLPSGEASPDNVNFKHLTIAPDGTLIVKDQTRPYGSTLQGTTAIIVGNLQGLSQPNGTLVAVDPETLEVLDSIGLPQPSTTPHIITEYDGKIAIYVAMNSIVQRYFWDPDAAKLSLDDSWEASPTVEGQSTADAPTVLGDWIVLQTNGIGSSTVSSSIVVVNQNDSTNTQTLFPFGDLQDGQVSLAPPKPGADPDNNMIYSADMGLGKIAGINFDPETGDMETAFVLDQTSSTFQMLIGPPDQRVLVLSNNVTNEDGSQSEQVTWNNPATGEQYAASDFFEPLTSNSVIPPGFGGRFYFPTALGVIAMQVMPTPEIADASADAGASSDAAAADDTASDAGDTAEIPEGWTSPQTMVSAMGPTFTLTPDSLSDARNFIYCELVFNYGDSGSDIYSTSPVAPCDLDWWDGLDLESLAAELGAESVNKNGPEWWAMDTVQEMTSDPTTVGGIQMVYGAVLPPGTMSTPQYEVFNTAKYQYLIYNAGSPTYQLVDPDGNAYILQGYKVDQDQLATLGDQFQSLPEGWSYQVVTPDEDLILNLTPAAPIPSVQDEFDQIYIQIPGQ